MIVMQHLVRAVRIGAVAMPIAAGVGYAVVYGIDFQFKLSCHAPNPFEQLHGIAAAWLVLALCQIAGFRARAGALDVWKLIVIAVSGLGLEACRELLTLPTLADNCQNLGAYDYADDYFGVDFVLLIFCVPVTAISALIGLAAAAKWQMRKDAVGTSRW